MYIIESMGMGMEFGEILRNNMCICHAI